MICEFLEDEKCLVSSRMAERDVLANPSACEACLSGKNPQGVNRVTASLAIGSELDRGKQQKMLADYRHLLRSKKRGKRMPKSPGGPGTELVWLIKKFATKKICGRCIALAYEMDQKGCDWVKENREDILDEMEINAKKLKVIFVRSVVTRLITISCWVAKKKGLSGGFT